MLNLSVALIVAFILLNIFANSDTLSPFIHKLRTYLLSSLLIVWFVSILGFTAYGLLFL